ncbi:MAG: NAD(P)-binding protein [Anaerovoracaceae bacterium]|nr:NAD(P)-binding protein [Bacillota bacterium]MDY3954014.1 NAD(P)-binding protein [Anaerovoracaceae bacterium]
MEYYYNQFEKCRQWEKPHCTTECPFHVDILDFIEKMGRGTYNTAYKTFRNAVVFPDIVAALCPQYCTACCARNSVDEPVQVNLLEKTCVAKAKRKDPTDYNVPAKDWKIGIIGAGMSGLSCALRTASKKCQVIVYEKSDRIGGVVRDMVPEEVFTTDIERQFKYENYTLKLNTEIKDIKELENEHFDAIYVATGKGGNDFGTLNQPEGHCRMEGETAVFAGGMLTGKDPVQAMADGLDMAWAMEVFIKVGRLEYPKGVMETKVVPNPNRLKETKGPTPSDNGIYTDEEVKEETARCIRCQCDACRTDCDLVAFYNKWPLKLRDEVTATVSPSDSIIHAAPAKKLINTCSQCGQLQGSSCPSKIELCDMIMHARTELHRIGKMPYGYHQYFLEDMDHANGSFAAIKKMAPGEKSCEYAFFPGCQLGATDPRYVEKSYNWLLSKKPDTALLLRCCNIPAKWSGDEQLHKDETELLRKDWEDLGKPKLILACPTCRNQLKEALPEIETVMLYEVMNQWGIEPHGASPHEMHCIFDPCAVRGDENIKKTVRELADKAGAKWEDLPKYEQHGCCGYGGQGAVANPEYVDFVIESRVNASEHPYIAYCINCRDNFRSKGKDALHILDLFFDINDDGCSKPSLTERRRNRERLKENLLKKIWGEKMEEKPEQKMKLKISPELTEKMDKLHIIEDDICKVLELAEQLKRRVYHPDTDSYTCFRQLGYTTYWVDYRPIGENEFEILNVYNHRIEIELEMIWNGRKTDFDLR